MRFSPAFSRSAAGMALMPVLLCLTRMMGIAYSSSYASLMSNYSGQLVTSSTLQWKASSNGIPPEAVQSGTGNAARKVCRAEHHGVLLLGQTSGKFCSVGFVDKILKKSKFEVLVNVDRASRLEWKRYSKFAGVPAGAVAVVDENDESFFGGSYIFIGRHLYSANGQGWRPGSIEVPKRASHSSFGTMRVFDQEKEPDVDSPSAMAAVAKDHSTGDVMVEVEPTMYHLDIHQGKKQESRRSRKKTTCHDTVLANSSLFRFDEGRDRTARLQKVISYVYESSDYYGQIHGMIRALPTTVRRPNGQTQSVLWGLPHVTRQEETMMVGHNLQHHTAVDVSIVGVKTTTEEPYVATLTSIFPDGTQRSRTVAGTVRKMLMNNIRPEYSRIYHIRDSDLEEKIDENELFWEPNGISRLKQFKGRKNEQASDQKADHVLPKPKRDEEALLHPVSEGSGSTDDKDFDGTGKQPAQLALPSGPSSSTSSVRSTRCMVVATVVVLLVDVLRRSYQRNCLRVSLEYIV